MHVEGSQFRRSLIVQGLRAIHTSLQLLIEHPNLFVKGFLTFQAVVSATCLGQELAGVHSLYLNYALFF